MTGIERRRPETIHKPSLALDKYLIRMVSRGEPDQAMTIRYLSDGGTLSFAYPCPTAEAVTGFVYELNPISRFYAV